MGLLATKPDGARIHVVAMGLQLSPEKLSEKIASSKRWTHVVAFRPTGMQPFGLLHCSVLLLVRQDHGCLEGLSVALSLQIAHHWSVCSYLSSWFNILQGCHGKPVVEWWAIR